MQGPFILQRSDEVASSRDTRACVDARIVGIIAGVQYTASREASEFLSSGDVRPQLIMVACPAAVLAGELADLRTRLDLLAADGDPRTQMRTVFS